MKVTASHPVPDSSNEVCAVCARDSGCDACFDELISRLQVPLMHHLVQRARNRQDAEDVLQETWLAAYRNIGKYNPAWRFTTWIFTIAHRQAISAARRPRSSESELARTGGVPAPGQGPDEAAAQSELQDSLWAKTKDILDIDAFTAVWLTYVEGMNAEDVGAVINRTANGVRILLTRSRARLADQLPEHWKPERSDR